MNLPSYNFNENWHDYINIEKLMKFNVDYSNEKETTNVEPEIDINNINFSLDNEKILNEINDIINIKNINSYTSLDILKHQDLLSSYLSKSIQNTDINITFLLKVLEWLKESSKQLNDRVKMKLFSHNESLIKPDKVIRSSYKFCNFKHNCSYNYDNKKKGCYADHYVHNMIYADIESLIKCITTYYIDSEIIQNKEIVKCVNTISFVIKHMYEELHNLCMYLKNKSEYNKYHVVKSSKMETNKKYNNSKKRNVNI